MKRLNYFNPYESKLPHHEDNLTRAFLVLLRYSLNVSHLFYDLCYKKFNSNKSSENIFEELPNFLEFIDEDIKYQTQKGNPIIETNCLASILITDKELIKKNDGNNYILKYDKNSRYDGVITYGKDLTFIIEVKPRSENVWFNQLNPTRLNLNDDTIVLKTGIEINWKDIISILNLVLKNPLISGQDKLMISDFLDYIDDEFPYLNPYDNFGLCKNNEEIIIRRIENIFKSIVRDESIVDYHRGWGEIIRISEYFKEINMIGLILNKESNEDRWKLILSISFGVLIPQARALYKHDLINNISKSNIVDEGWIIKPDFRLTYRGDNLIDIPQGNLESYIEYFTSNELDIRQFKRDEVQTQLEKLYENNVLVFNTEVQKLFEEKYLQKNYDKANFCSGINLKFEIPDDLAIEKDSKKGEFAKFLVEKIREAFTLIGDQKTKLDELFKDEFN